MRIITPLLVAVFTLSACESSVNGDLGLGEYDPKTVVNAAVSSDQAPYIQVVKSKGILDSSPYDYEPNAVVELIQGSHRVTLKHSEYGRYITDEVMATGPCTLEVTTPTDFLTASDDIPSLVPITSASLIDTVALLNHSVPVSLLTLELDDPADEENYYELILYQYGDGDTIELCPFNAYSLSIVSGSAGDILGNSEDFIKEGLLIDDLFDGQTLTLELQVLQVFHDRTLFISLKTLSKTYFDYLLQKQKAREASENPFSEPVTMQTNIDGGLGIMVGYAVALDSVIAE